MDIISRGHCKFVYGTTTIEIEYSKLEAIFMKPMEDNLFESKLNGNRYLKKVNHYSRFVVFEHLYKYPNPESKLLSYNFYKGKQVYFYPFSDGESVKNELGKAVYFTLTNISPFYLNSTDYHDVILLTFESNENVITSYVEKFGYGFKHSTQYGENL